MNAKEKKIAETKAIIADMKNKDILRKGLNEDLIILGVALKQAYADFDSYSKLEAERTEKVLALNKLIEE